MDVEQCSVAPPALLYVPLVGDVTQVDVDSLDLTGFSVRELEILTGLINHAGNLVRSEMRRRSKTSWTPGR